MQAGEECVLAVSDRQLGVLGGRGDDLHQTADLGLGVERHGEELDGGVVDVVVGGDHAQVQRGHVHLVLDRDALGLFEVGEGLLDHFRQVVREVTVGHALKHVERGGKQVRPAVKSDNN